MKRREDLCGCVARFLNTFSATSISNLNGLSYEDEACYVECVNDTV